MSESYHTASRFHGIYNVYKIWDLTANLDVVQIPIKQLLSILNERFWDDPSTGSNDAFSPMDVITGKVKSEYHKKRIFEADLSFPILVLDQNEYRNILNTKIYDFMLTDSYFDILDGLHRLVKAYLLGLLTIDAKIVPWKILQLAKIGNFKNKN